MTVPVAEKSPLRRSAGGSVVNPLVPSPGSNGLPPFDRWRVVSSLKKKKSLSGMMGPPIVPPKTCMLDVPLSWVGGRK